MTKFKEIELETLHELMICDEDAGTLTWRKRPQEFFKTKRAFSIWNKRYAGKPAFTAVSDGYRVGAIFYKNQSAHRVIWAMVHGEWAYEIDHINGDRADNRLINLRSVDRLENRRNARMSRNNTSGTCGVHWSNRDNYWVASIFVKYKCIFLGNFKLKTDAIAARKAGEIKYGFHENHGQLQAVS